MDCQQKRGKADDVGEVNNDDARAMSRAVHLIKEEKFGERAHTQKTQKELKRKWNQEGKKEG